MKNAIKPYYQKNEINKDEYKEIVRKAVEKVQASLRISYTCYIVFNLKRSIILTCLSGY